MTGNQTGGNGDQDNPMKISKLRRLRRRFSTGTIPRNLKAAGATLALISSVAASWMKFKSDFPLLIGAIFVISILLIGIWALLSDKNGILVRRFGIAGLIIVFVAGAYFILVEFTARHDGSNFGDFRKPLDIEVVVGESGDTVEFNFDPSAYNFTRVELRPWDKIESKPKNINIDAGTGRVYVDMLEPASAYDAVFFRSGTFSDKGVITIHFTTSAVMTLLPWPYFSKADGLGRWEIFYSGPTISNKAKKGKIEFSSTSAKIFFKSSTQVLTYEGPVLNGRPMGKGKLADEGCMAVEFDETGLVSADCERVTQNAPRAKGDTAADNTSWLIKGTYQRGVGDFIGPFPVALEGPATIDWLVHENGAERELVQAYEGVFLHNQLIHGYAHSRPTHLGVASGRIFKSNWAAPTLVLKQTSFEMSPQGGTLAQKQKGYFYDFSNLNSSVANRKYSVESTLAQMWPASGSILANKMCKYDEMFGLPSSLGKERNFVGEKYRITVLDSDLYSFSIAELGIEVGFNHRSGGHPFLKSLDATFPTIRFSHSAAHSSLNQEVSLIFDDAETSKISVGTGFNDPRAPTVLAMMCAAKTMRQAEVKTPIAEVAGICPMIVTMLARAYACYEPAELAAVEILNN